MMHIAFFQTVGDGDPSMNAFPVEGGLIPSAHFNPWTFQGYDWSLWTNHERLRSLDQPIPERHHGFLSTLAEAGRRNVKYMERDNRFDFSRAYRLHLSGVRLTSFSNATLQRL